MVSFTTQNIPRQVCPPTTSLHVFENIPRQVCPPTASRQHLSEAALSWSHYNAWAAHWKYSEAGMCSFLVSLLILITTAASASASTNTQIITLCRDKVSTFHGDPPDYTLHPWSTSCWTVPSFHFLLGGNQSLPEKWCIFYYYNSYYSVHQQMHKHKLPL